MSGILVGNLSAPIITEEGVDVLSHITDSVRIDFITEAQHSQGVNRQAKEGEKSMAVAEDLALLKKIDACYHQLTGEGLYCPADVEDRYLWLHEQAPYSILAHGRGPDPIFMYANHCALHCFKYSREEMLQLPSRLSAGPSDRAARQVLLDTVTRDGIAKNYTGPRVDQQGNSFIIYDGEVWQLGRDSGDLWGQAALFWPVPRPPLGDPILGVPVIKI